MISLASSAARSPMSTTAELFDFLSRRGQPALCQYQGTERIEISGRVLTNWATKVANLVDAHFPTPPERFVLVGPAHWKFFAIAFGVRLLGIEPEWVAGEPAQAADQDLGDALLVTHASADTLEGAGLSAAELIQVDLATLATEFGADLDPFAIDFALEVPAQPDQLLVRITPAEIPQAREGNTLIGPDPQAQTLGHGLLLELALSTWAGGHALVISDDENLAAAQRQEAPRFSVRLP